MLFCNGCSATNRGIRINPEAVGGVIPSLQVGEGTEGNNSEHEEIATATLEAHLELGDDR